MKFEFNDDSQKICNSADVVNYGIQCDICGNKFQSVSNINGRRYCAGCYYKTFIKDNQQTEIDQLKQQLEESFTEEDVNGLIEDRDKTIKFLQKELAEKDKEIERLNTIKNNAIECADLFKVALSVRQKDLAIQELEKVKDLLLIENKNNPIVYDLNDYTRGGALDRDKTFEIIDQQIKELKGENK